MDTKALKKQMGAAIAMVLVAAIALGSATFAWFVTNSKVTASTSKISAQSNAAFMTIENGTQGAKNSDKKTVTTMLTNPASTALYPATYGEADMQYKGKWMTGYGTSLTDGRIDGSLKECADPNGTETAGTTAAAIAGEYTLKEDFNVSSKGQNLKNLKIEKVEGTTDVTQDNPSLKKALRVLVTNADGTKYEVWGLNDGGTSFERKLSSETNNGETTLTDTVTAGEDTVVHVYLYYEGSQAYVTSRNLQDQKLSATDAATVTFVAEADNK